MLYEKCEICEGSGEILNTTALSLSSPVCPACAGEKYLPTGLTTGQVSHMAQTRGLDTGGESKRFPFFARGDLVYHRASGEKAILLSIGDTRVKVRASIDGEVAELLLCELEILERWEKDNE